MAMSIGAALLEAQMKSKLSSIRSGWSLVLPLCVGGVIKSDTSIQDEPVVRPLQNLPLRMHSYSWSPFQSLFTVHFVDKAGFCRPHLSRRKKTKGGDKNFREFGAEIFITRNQGTSKQR